MITKKKNGFTLIEMIVVATLIGLLSGAISTLIAMGNKSFRLGIKRVNNYEATAKSMHDFDRYSRGAVQILEAEEDKITFLAFLKADLRPAPTKIGYYLENGELFRFLIYPVASGDTYVYPDETKVTTEIVQGVMADDLFAYYNDNSALLSFPVTLGQVKMVKFSITINLNGQTPPGPAESSTSIQFRNLKTNL